MAIPLLIGVAAGAVGVYKAINAYDDSQQAEKMNNSAESIVSDADDRLENSKQSCQKSLENLGQKKVDILEKRVPQFIETFEKIKNVDFGEAENLGKLTVKEFNEAVIGEMRKSINFLTEAGLGASGGAVAGALTAFGAYGLTTSLAVASTGTAIGSLSGAAATNATLAWLGGGSLASGGMGIAGGTVALGALAAGPALLIAGWYMGNKAEESLNNAKANKAEAERYAADVDAAIALTDGIRHVAETAIDILSKLNKHARRSINKLNELIIDQGVDFSQYSEDGKDLVLRTVTIMTVIKEAINLSILDKGGNLLGDVKSNLKKVQNGMAEIDN